jgi:ethanolamine utilization protein EutA
LFARQAGKMVAVSAGDSLETTMAAYGSGAVARSIRDKATVMNVDVGGGTSKIAVCADGQVIDLTALDVGARLICVDAAGRITRLEEAGRRFGKALGLSLELGATLSPDAAQALASRMADCLRTAWPTVCSRRSREVCRPWTAPGCCGSIRSAIVISSTR